MDTKSVDLPISTITQLTEQVSILQLVHNKINSKLNKLTKLIMAQVAKPTTPNQSKCKAAGCLWGSPGQETWHPHAASKVNGSFNPGIVHTIIENPLSTSLSQPWIWIKDWMTGGVIDWERNNQVQFSSFFRMWMVFPPTQMGTSNWIACINLQWRIMQISLHLQSLIWLGTNYHTKPSYLIKQEDGGKYAIGVSLTTKKINMVMASSQAAQPLQHWMKWAHCTTRPGDNITGLGRRSWVRIWGRDNHHLWIIVAYHLCKSNGHLTTYQQQIRWLATAGCTIWPRKKILDDLQEQVIQWHSDGDSVIIMADMNEDVREDPMLAVVTNMGVANAVTTQHGHQSPNTHNQRSAPIDCIFLPTNLIQTFSWAT